MVARGDLKRFCSLEYVSHSFVPVRSFAQKYLAKVLNLIKERNLYDLQKNEIKKKHSL